jgi:calcineurin-like phosphoesterase family protein
MKYFFTSDHHFSHNNIIKFCNRPFSSVTEMNDEMIDRYNSVVNKRDIVFIVGDFSFDTKPKNHFDKLNGQKFLIKGNHDKKKTIDLPWAGVFDIKEVVINKQPIVLHHYSMRSWNKSFHGSWHLYGHSHGTLPPHGLSFDVGVDTNNFYPYSFDDVVEKMKTLKKDVE